MEKIKNIISGVLSGVVLFMAVQVSIAGQSSAKSSAADETEELMTIKNTETGITAAKIIQTGELWVAVSIINPSNPETDATNQRVEEEPEETEPSGSCSPLNTGPICSVKLDFTNADEDEVDDLITQLNDPMQPNPTIQDFLDADAEYTGPINDAEYSRALTDQ